MTVIGVSSFSLWEPLGGLRIPVGPRDGQPADLVLARPMTMTLLEFPALARARLGVEYIEICQIQMRDSSDAAVGALAAALGQAGVRLLNLPIDVGDISEPDEDQREAGLVQMQKWIGIAGRLGAAFGRVRASVDPDDKAAWPVAVASLRRLADYAAARGVRLLIENQGAISARPDALIGLIGAVGPDRLGLLLDTGNFEPVMSFGQAAISGQPAPDGTMDLEPIYDAIRFLAPHACLVHAKAHGFTAAGEHTPMDLRRALTIVREAGFAGPVSVEYEGVTGDPWHNTARTIATARAVFSS
jgi:sugar phosphate isomerase/epimerase